jgi:hypothetical protein
MSNQPAGRFRTLEEVASTVGSVAVWGAVDTQ